MSSKVGFIGLGIMGKPMAGHLIKAGYDVTVYNRTSGKTDELVQAGAKVAATPRECAEGKDIVITIVTDSPDVEAVLFGENGAAEGAQSGSVVIDMSTISPDVTRDIAARLNEKGIGFLDAPVSGGDIGAQKGTLTIMVGGDDDTFARAKDVFEPMGQRITHVGPVGAGQVTKASNQILCAVNLLESARRLRWRTVLAWIWRRSIRSSLEERRPPGRSRISARRSSTATTIQDSWLSSSRRT
jgi:3-hydroxyisobutyrate dehydrogenase-like beta-hydroxyacid dehydrogenase